MSQSTKPETPVWLSLFRSFTNAHFATCADEYREGASDAGVARRYDDSAKKEKAFIDAIHAMEAERNSADLAVTHVLSAICDDARKFWLMGHGTGSRDKLLKAWAALHGKTYEEADAYWVFYDADKFKRYVEELELMERLLRDYREGRIQLPAE